MQIETAIVRGTNIEEAVKHFPIKFHSFYNATRFFDKISKDRKNLYREVHVKFICEQFLRYKEAYRLGCVGYIRKQKTHRASTDINYPIITRNVIKGEWKHGYLIYKDQNKEIVDILYISRAKELLPKLRELVKIHDTSLSAIQIKVKNIDVPKFQIIPRKYSDARLAEYFIFYCTE